MRAQSVLRGVVALVALGLSQGCRAAPPPPSAGAAAAPALQKPAAPPAVAEPTGAAAPSGTRRFGAPLTPGESPLTLASILAKPDDFASRTVTVEAKVRRNCTRRKC